MAKSVDALDLGSSRAIYESSNLSRPTFAERKHMSTSVKIIGEYQNDHGKWLPLNPKIVNKFWPERNQNYTTFCAWAGIRRETAEKRVGHPITSIAEDRRFPKDWNVKEDDDLYKIGFSNYCYGFTWMTIAEIVTYDWSVLGKESQNLGKKALSVWPDKTQHDKIRLVMGFD